MKKIVLKKLNLSYFKGIKSLSIDFDEFENFIYGRNEAGKTTLFDAVWWLFFGKESSGRADFSIKTYDQNNRVIEKVDHEVEGVFLINGMEKTFKRTYREVWSKSENILKTHTTDYHIDGFPVRTETEYKKAVSELFDEEIFKLLTNPLFFNSLKMEQRRSALINMVDGIDDNALLDQIVSKNHTKPFLTLQEIFQKQKDLSAIRLKYQNDKRLFKAEKEAIPSRIDEAIRSKPEEYNWSELEEIIHEKKAEIEAIDAQITDANEMARKANQLSVDMQNQIYSLQRKQNELRQNAQIKSDNANMDQSKEDRKIKSEIQDLEHKIQLLKRDISDNVRRVSDLRYEKQTRSEKIQALQKEKAQLVEDWKEVNALQFNFQGGVCPTCNRELEEVAVFDLKEEKQAKFNREKAERLKMIESQGNALKEKILLLETDTSIDSRISELDSVISKIEKEVKEKQAEIESKRKNLDSMNERKNINYSYSDFLSPEYNDLNAKIAEIEKSIQATEKPDNSHLIAEKRTAQDTLENLQKSLGNRETIARIDKRIQELKDQESDLANRISECEGVEDAIFTFSKERMQAIEDAINTHFSLVKFKMFEMQMNGQEKEICDAIYKGVPFQDLNTAGKIQAGLDIIRAIANKSEIWLPIFIDNRESVHEIPSVDSQVINLIASKEHKELKVEKFHLQVLEK